MLLRSLNSLNNGARAVQACSSTGSLTQRALAACATAEQQQTREQLHYDLCIVGGGAAGMSAAIRFKQVDLL